MSAPRQARTLPLIGRREYVGLPDCGLQAVLAKIDTGARTSALHAEEMTLLDPDPITGLPRQVRFATGGWAGAAPRLVTLPLRAQRRVRNPGRSQLRPMVSLALQLGPFRLQTVVSLTDRSDMRCPLLLGRRALAGRFLVDVRTLHYLGRPGEVTAEAAATATLPPLPLSLPR